MQLAYKVTSEGSFAKDFEMSETLILIQNVKRETWNLKP